jgi:uncharacterized protein YkwD
MSSTVEVSPARRHSRARFLVLIPLLPALAALAFVAIVPLSTVSSDEIAQSLPATVIQPAAATAKAMPAITASPSPSAAAAAAEIFAAPPITILPPPPPPPPKKATGHRSSGHTVTSGRCSAGGITTTSVSSAPYSGYEQENLGYLNQARADNGLGGLSWSGGLSNNARAWARYLADNNCTGSEVGHSTIWKNGENLYWISGGAGGSLALRAHNAFMNSSGHRANILRESFRSVGVGIAHGPGGWYLVQNFSR